MSAKDMKEQIKEPDVQTTLIRAKATMTLIFDPHLGAGDQTWQQAVDDAFGRLLDVMVHSVHGLGAVAEYRDVHFDTLHESVWDGLEGKAK